MLLIEEGSDMKMNGIVYARKNKYPLVFFLISVLFVCGLQANNTFLYEYCGKSLLNIACCLVSCLFPALSVFSSSIHVECLSSLPIKI